MDKLEIVKRSWIPALQYEYSNNYWGYGAPIVVSIDGHDWRHFSTVDDVKAWSIEQVLNHVKATFPELIFVDERNRPLPNSEKAREAGEDTALLFATVLRSDVPDGTYYRLCRKFASWDGYQGDAAFDYVEGCMTTFSSYRTSNMVSRIRDVEVPDK